MKWQSLLPLLQCPACQSGQLEVSNEGLVCRSCQQHYPVVRDVPVFHALGEKVSVVGDGHRSNPIYPAALERLKKGHLSLNIGAGASAEKLANVIEFEFQLFKTTDVCGDAHRLPFKSSCFDFVCAMNVFEHLHSPHEAAREIHRVLKPGGEVLIHTAFLQPLHEAPHHYYNATEFGVRKWFEPFEVSHCSVSQNFSPEKALGFILSTLLYECRPHFTPETILALEQTTLGDWADYWAALRGKTDISLNPCVIEAIQALSPAIKSRFSAGFELLGKKSANSTI